MSIINNSKMKHVASLDLPAHSCKAIANSLRAYILTCRCVVKPIGYIIQDGLTVHIDNVSEELYFIHQSLSELEYNLALNFEDVKVIDYEFSGTITNKTIQKVLKEAKESLDNIPEKTIMTIVPNKKVKISIIFSNQVGHRTVEENNYLIEELNIGRESISNINPFSSTHITDMKIAFDDELIIDTYYKRVKFYSDREDLFREGLELFKNLTKNW